jgi:hypothetical protein
MKILIALMAYLNMFSLVTIGDIQIKNISGFEVTQTLTDMGDKATITLARNYKDLAEKPVTNYIKTGMPVKIEAGYNGNLYTEFEGYVSEAPMADIPLVVHADELWKLRQGNINKSYRSVTLRALLEENVPAYKIDCPDVVLGKMFLNNVSPYRMLEDIKKNFGFYTKVYNGNVLHVGWAYDWQPDFRTKHEYYFGGTLGNVKSASALKFKHKEDFATKVKVTTNIAGVKKTIEFGSTDKEAAIVEYNMGSLPAAEALKLAQARHAKASWDGFEGSVTGWGVPRVKAGDSVGFTSLKYPGRNGYYLAQSVTTKYDESGFERNIKLGFRL